MAKKAPAKKAPAKKGRPSIYSGPLYQPTTTLAGRPLAASARSLTDLEYKPQLDENQRQYDQNSRNSAEALRRLSGYYEKLTPLYKPDSSGADQYKAEVGSVQTKAQGDALNAAQSARFANETGAYQNYTQNALASRAQRLQGDAGALAARAQDSLSGTQARYASQGNALGQQRSSLQAKRALAYTTNLGRLRDSEFNKYATKRELGSAESKAALDAQVKLAEQQLRQQQLAEQQRHNQASERNAYLNATRPSGGGGGSGGLTPAQQAKFANKVALLRDQIIPDLVGGRTKMYGIHGKQATTWGALGRRLQLLGLGGRRARNGANETFAADVVHEALRQYNAKHRLPKR